MGLFDSVANTQVNNEVKEDKIFTGGYTFAGGAYPTGISCAYIEQSEFNGVVSKKLVVQVELKVLVEGKERQHQQSFYISDDDGNIQFKNTKGELVTTKGYKDFDTLCQLAIGKKFRELEAPQIKAVEAYGKTSDKEVFMELRHAKILGGFVLETKDKNQQVNGKWEPTGETKTQNRLDWSFDLSTERTLFEKTHNKDADFIKKWKETYEGKEINLAKGKKGAGVSSGAPAKPDTEAKPLF